MFWRQEARFRAQAGCTRIYLHLKDDPNKKPKNLGGAALIVTMAPNLKATSKYDQKVLAGFHQFQHVLIQPWRLQFEDA